MLLIGVGKNSHTCLVAPPLESWDWTAALTSPPTLAGNHRSSSGHWGNWLNQSIHRKDFSDIFCRLMHGNTFKLGGYLLWLCLSVWLSILNNRGNRPDRRFTGDFTLHWGKHILNTHNYVAILNNTICAHLSADMCQTPATQTGGEPPATPWHCLHGDASPSHRPLKHTDVEVKHWKTGNLDRLHKQLCFVAFDIW